MLLRGFLPVLRFAFLVPTRCEQSKIRVGNRGTCGLGEGLKSNGILKKLDLVRVLFMPNIHVLTYGGQSGNEIGDTGSCSIGEALKLNGSLQFLNLVGECWFFCLLFRGFSKIFIGRISVFYSTCWLQSSNRIGDDGSCNIGEALNWNSSLRILNFVSVHSVS